MCLITEQSSAEEENTSVETCYSDKIQNHNSNFLISSKHPTTKSLNINYENLCLHFKYKFILINYLGLIQCGNTCPFILYSRNFYSQNIDQTKCACWLLFCCGRFRVFQLKSSQSRQSSLIEIMQKLKLVPHYSESF